MSINAPKQAVTDQEITDCYAVLSELRPHLVENTFLSTIRMQEQEGYRLAYIAIDNKVVACAGYRIINNLSVGRSLYVDDLVTASRARSAGHGQALLQWLEAKAKASQCSFFHLDSGVQRQRAHKFYFKNNLSIVYYHFAKPLDNVAP